MKPITSLAARTAIIVSLGVACALPASAQSSGGTAGGNSGPSVESRSVDTDNDRDYGWIGLLGLAGLLGLRRKRDDHVNTTTDTHRPTSR